MREVYLDHAATTAMDPRVKEAMEPYWTTVFGNPSTLYRPGRLAKDALDGARMKVAELLHARPEEIIFTGSGTESDNMAIFGACRMFKDKGAKHLITVATEHHAILHSFEALEREGWEVTYLPVDEDGLVAARDAREAIRPDTLLISVMYVNNEIGVIQPIEEIGALIKEIRRERGEVKNQLPLYFHTDAAQAAGCLDLNVDRLGVDLLSLNGGKIYGPKGVGCLFMRRGISLKPIIYGGGQEKNLRSGTENIPGIVGLAKAFEIAAAEREQENMRLTELRDYFIHRLTSEIPKTVLNGHATRRAPNNVNVSVLDIEGEAVILYLDAKGIYITTGSACTSTTLDPSHVILALGKPYEYAHSSLRFTFGRKTTKEDLDYVMEVFPAIVVKLRQISPIRMEVGQKQISHPEAFAGQGSKVKVGGRTYK